MKPDVCFFYSMLVSYGADLAIAVVGNCILRRFRFQYVGQLCNAATVCAWFGNCLRLRNILEADTCEEAENVTKKQQTFRLLMDSRFLQEHIMVIFQNF